MIRPFPHRTVHHLEHSAALFQELTAVMRQKTTAEWEAIFDQHDVPCGPVLNVADLIDHPQVTHRQLIEPLGRGRMRVPVRTVKYGGFAETIRKPPPRLGEDMLSVLRDFGCTDAGEDLGPLLDEGVLEDPSEPRPAAGRARRKRREDIS